MKCRKHKKYKGIYKPKCDCSECWTIYNKKKLGNTTNVKIIYND